MIARILVGLDSSTRAPGVFRAAVEVGARFSATVRPFRAVSVPPEFPAAAFGSVADPLRTRLTKLALDDIARLAAGTIEVELEPPVVRVGDPARLILEVCNEFDVDLVVIGSHGYSGLDHVLGTTAAHVANLARCSVLVVHERRSHAPAHRSNGLPGAGL